MSAWKALMTLFAGYQIRSHAASLQFVGELISRRVIPVELVHSFYYHLDTCFCPLREGAALYFPGAFDDYGRKALHSAIDDLIEVQDEEARSFAPPPHIRRAGWESDDVMGSTVFLRTRIRRSRRAASAVS